MAGANRPGDCWQSAAIHLPALILCFDVQHGADDELLRAQA